MVKQLLFGMGFLAFLAVLISSSLLLQNAPSQASMPTPRINLGAFEEIREGMSKQQVERILGVPSGDYCSGNFIAFDIYSGGVLMMGGQREDWFGNDGIVQVGFDSHDNVLWKRFVKVAHWEDKSWWENVRDWLLE